MPFILASCGGKEERIVQIGISQSNQDDWRDKMNDEIERQAMFNPALEVEIRSADWSNTKQSLDIRHFIEKRVDAIIVSPNDADSLSPSIQEAIDRGIPVITVDRAMTIPEVTTHIEVDNEAIGRRAASFALARLSSTGGIRALELQGKKDMTPVRRRHEGFAKVLDSISDASIVESIYCDWDADKASRVTDSILRRHSDINFIFAHNDNMAIKVADVLEKRNRRDILLVGIDGIPKEGIQAVTDGKMDATLLYPTEGAFILDRAVDIVRGLPVEKTYLISPLPPVEKEEAQILLQQNRMLDQETREIKMLRDKVAEYLDRYTLQRMLLFTTLGIIVVLFALIFLIMSSTWRRIRRTRAFNIETKEESFDDDPSSLPGLRNHDNAVNTENGEDTTNAFYLKFLEIVDRNIHNPNLNIEDIASEIGLSKSQLGRRIKHISGYTPVEIIRNRRLKRAKILLTSSFEKSISEVAYAVGFSLPAYFSKCYRDFYGESPTEVRRRVFGGGDINTSAT